MRSAIHFPLETEELMRSWPFVLLLLALGSRVQAAPRADNAKALQDLFAAAWDYDMQERPEEASEMGDRRWNDRWTDRSPEAYARRDQHNHEVLAQLAKIDRNGLNKTDQLNYDLFRKRYLDRLDNYKFHWFLMNFNQREGPQTIDDLSSSLRFETVKDYEDWLARMRAIPTHLDQVMAFLRQGIRERMVHPRIIMERIPAQRAVSTSRSGAFPRASARLISSGSSKRRAGPWSSRLCRPSPNSSSSS
jgi:prolyl oligopeptidase